MNPAVRIAFLAVGAATALPAFPAGRGWPEAGAAAQVLVESGRDPLLSRPVAAADLPSLKALYAADPAALFWFDGESPRRSVEGCLETLAHADRSGLDPADYGAAALAAGFAALRASPRPSADDAARFDVGLTAAFMRLLGDVHQGRVDPRTVAFDIDVSGKRLDLPAVLRSARDGAGGCAAAFAAAEPPFEVYRRLVQVLARYRALAAGGEPPMVPALEPKVKKIEPGQHWSGVAPLDARLRALGDLPADAPAPSTGPDGTPLFAGPIVDGLKRYQDRNALEPDGVIGPSTIAALNTPFTARVHQIELALERLRWLPQLPDRRLIFVNIPLFTLWALEPDQPENNFRMRVVTGKSAGHATPIFIGQMEYLIFRPYWNPPPSINRNEILPHARRDPAYLERQNMEIVASGAVDAEALPATEENLARVASGKLTLRQRPGGKNSLGLVKFIFPNTNNVYMHGTPSQKLFSRARRDFSHGCIRLEDPTRLAEWVLNENPAWTRERIEKAMAGDRPLQVNLETPIPVVIFYDTVLVDANGVVHFSDDYYRHDARLDAALHDRR